MEQELGEEDLEQELGEQEMGEELGEEEQEEELGQESADDSDSDAEADGAEGAGGGGAHKRGRANELRDQPDELLYVGASEGTTLRWYCMDFLKVWLQHKLSTTAADALLRRDAGLLPPGNRVPPSTYLLRKVLGCAPARGAGRGQLTAGGRHIRRS